MSRRIDGGRNTLFSTLFFPYLFGPLSTSTLGWDGACEMYWHHTTWPGEVVVEIDSVQLITSFAHALGFNTGEFRRISQDSVPNLLSFKSP